MGIENQNESLVAKRLRVIRKSKGFSQRELARRAGVGSGTISLIESMTTQPSVAVLKKILDGIPMDLATFFSFELEQKNDRFYPKSSHVDIGSPGVKYLLVGARRPNRRIQMLHEIYDPGKASGKTSISHAGEECAIVVSGVLELTLGEDVYILKRGDAYYFNSETPHKFRNIGSDECEVISACLSTF